VSKQGERPHPALRFVPLTSAACFGGSSRTRTAALPPAPPQIWGCSQDQSNHIVHEFFESDHFNDGIPIIPGVRLCACGVVRACVCVCVCVRACATRACTVCQLPLHTLPAA
jgi:hypothetical protein